MARPTAIVRTILSRRKAMLLTGVANTHFSLLRTEYELESRYRQ